MKRINGIFRNLIPVAALALAAGSTPVMAQEEAPSQREAPATTISDEQLERFSGAYEDVREIQAKAETQLGSAQDTQQAEQVQQQANEEMLKAVQDNGLEADEFNQIARAVNTDPDVQKRLEKIQQDGKKDSSSQRR